MNNTTTQTLTVADTILAQLGDQRFLAMTGAKYLMGDADSLQFKLPRGCKSGINCVRIVLDASDLYTITFYKLGRTYDSTTISEAEMVPADKLRAVFTSATGLECTLGTLGGR